LIVIDRRNLFIDHGYPFIDRRYPFIDRGYLNINRPSSNSDDRSLSPFPNGLTPDAAINEVQRMEKGDRSIDSIVLTTDLDRDVFCIRAHDSSVVFLGFA
jgi:hypothetical protein